MSCNSPIPDCIPCQDCPPAGATYIYSNCVNGEKCEDIYGSECVNYKGPHLPALGILNNDRLITILTKLHKVVNVLKGVGATPIQQYTATCTPATGTTTPFVITYLGLGPVYTSTPGAAGTTTTIVVGSTTGLIAGMTLEVVSGIGTFAANTTVVTIVNGTTFTISAPLTTALSNNAVIKGTGSDHQIFNLTVQPNAPQTFKAYAGSPVVVSGTGTIV